MVEGALFHLAGKVLELLASFALPEVKLAIGVETEIEKLTNTVITIQAVILNAEKQSSHNPQIKEWLRKLTDVLLDADDLLDDFYTEVLRRKVMTGSKKKKEVRIFFSSSNQLALSLKMGHEIKAIRERLNFIAKDKDDFQLIQTFLEPQVMNRETYSFVLEDEVIGREDDKKAIVERLFNDNVVENISIIPIVGIGGLGKTTLAQVVYNDEPVKNYFDLKLWICISDMFDVKLIVREMLQQLTKRKHKESLEILQNQLREKLCGKKYLIVLDDLWNEECEQWFLLRNLLMGGARGSRIIVTTRSESVARITGATSWHALKGLPEKKAWILFVNLAFEQGQLPKNQAFRRLGEEIVEKCGGLPLAIRTIATLLRTKASENEWRTFKNYELPKLAQEEENHIISTLKLSYDHLPSYLKQCFAYCRLFPKDYKIHVETLIHLWAAQGFITLSNPKQRVKDVGREYFLVLLWRSFFQDVEKDELGNIAYCKMHDLMYDLATLVAGTESIMLTSSKEYIAKKVRHLSFDHVDSLNQFPIPIVKGMKIRTILAASVGGELGNLTCNAIISSFNYLRTLDLSMLELHAVPLSIGKLKHLRYLDLSENGNIKMLPNSITKLLNLQTLILKNCHSLRELSGIKKLVNLRYLDITNCYKLADMTLEIRHLTSLEIVLPRVFVSKEDFKASCCGLYEKKMVESNGGPSQLKELSNLGGILEIGNLGHGKDDMLECDANLKEKEHLQLLELHWDATWVEDTECYDEMSLKRLEPHPNLKVLELHYYMGVRLPSWVSSHTNLVCLVLYYNCKLQHLSPLNQLPFLKSLTFYGIDALKYVSEDKVGNVLNSSSSKIPFFPSLSTLRIEQCPNLKGWWRNSNDDNEPNNLLLPSFPCLLRLEILKCPKLTCMPLFPYLKEELQLHVASWKVLQQTMEMGATTSTSSSSCCFPLSQLQSLKFVEVKDLESLPKRWLQNLISLRELSINWCRGLRSLPWIGNLTSLQRLQIGGCPDLTSLPQGIRHLTSLKRLQISGCPNLMSLPQGIRCLTSLKYLGISRCSVLRERCQSGTGADWSYIAHVPEVYVNGENQQKQTIS